MLSPCGHNFSLGKSGAKSKVTHPFGRAAASDDDTAKATNVRVGSTASNILRDTALSISALHRIQERLFTELVVDRHLAVWVQVVEVARGAQSAHDREFRKARAAGLSDALTGSNDNSPLPRSHANVTCKPPIQSEFGFWNPQNCFIPPITRPKVPYSYIMCSKFSSTTKNVASLFSMF